MSAPAVAELAHQRALGLAERPAKDLMPGVPHQPQQHRHVPGRERSVGIEPLASHEALGLHERLPLVEVLELPLDEGCEPRLEQFHCFADAFVVRGGHGGVLYSSVASARNWGNNTGISWVTVCQTVSVLISKYA